MSDPSALARAIAARGMPPPAGVEWHSSITSTNDRLKELARQGAPEWTLVLADQQTGGRGRAGRCWQSPLGGLYLSALLRPRSRDTGLIPLAAGVAVAEAAAEMGVPAVLKWPNDVLVPAGEDDATGFELAPERKLAGILAEAASGGAGTEWVVLGIGVNVKRDGESFGPGSTGGLVTLADLAPGRPPEIAVVAAAVLDRLRLWYDALDSSPASVVRAWRGRAVRWWGAQVEVYAGDGRVRGRLLDVDGGGALLIEVEGATRRLMAGEVFRLRRES